MGQKTHPIGLRVGTHRKWVSSWYSSFKDYNNFFQITHKQSYTSNGVINSRGGNFVSSREDFIENYIMRYPFTKVSGARRRLPVDFRLFKGYAGHTYGFIIYTKLLSNRLLFNNIMYTPIFKTFYSSSIAFSKKVLRQPSYQSNKVVALSYPINEVPALISYNSRERIYYSYYVKPVNYNQYSFIKNVLTHINFSKNYFSINNLFVHSSNSRYIFYFIQLIAFSNSHVFTLNKNKIIVSNYIQYRFIFKLLSGVSNKYIHNFTMRERFYYLSVIAMISQLSLSRNSVSNSLNIFNKFFISAKQKFNTTKYYNTINTKSVFFISNNSRNSLFSQRPGSFFKTAIISNFAKINYCFSKINKKVIVNIPKQIAIAINSGYNIKKSKKKVDEPSIKNS